MAQVRAEIGTSPPGRTVAATEVQQTHGRWRIVQRERRGIGAASPVRSAHPPRPVARIISQQEWRNDHRTGVWITLRGQAQIG
jgi:hypothetical protein